MGTQTQYIKQKHLGVIQDLAPEEVPPEHWTRVINVSFPDGDSRRREGYSDYAAPLPADQLPFYGGSVTGVDGINYWVWMTLNQVWVTDGDTHTDITPVGGLLDTDPGTWTFTTLGGIPVFNNPTNPPMYWDLNLANPALVLPGWPAGALCRSMRAVKYHLVALNITEDAINYPSQVWWSEGAQAGAIPAEWIPTAQNDAGDAILGDSAAGIVDAFPLRDQLIIYKNSSTYTMQYVAGQYVYAFRKLFPTVGMQSLNCACEIEGKQVVFTGEDVIMHDGQNFQSIVDQKVQRTLVDSVDKDNIALCNVIARVVDRQVWVCLPVTGEQYLSAAYVINVDDGLVGLISLPNVASVARGTIDPAGLESSEEWDQDNGQWDLDNTIWTQTVFSPTNDSVMMFQPAGPKLLANGRGTSADGQPVQSTLERLSMRVGEGIYHSVITQIAPQIEGETGMQVDIRMGYQNYFGDPITWLPAKPFYVGQSRAISQIIDGRYLSIQFQFDTETDWRMHGYYLKIKEGGEY